MGRPVKPVAPVAARPIYPWMTLEQAAEFCGVSYTYLRKAAQSSELATYQTPSQGQTAKILVDAADLEAWRQRHFVYRPALE